MYSELESDWLQLRGLGKRENQLESHSMLRFLRKLQERMTTTVMLEKPFL
jgi:hypothetical protein